MDISFTIQQFFTYFAIYTQLLSISKGPKIATTHKFQISQKKKQDKAFVPKPCVLCAGQRSLGAPKMT